MQESRAIRARGIPDLDLEKTLMHCQAAKISRVQATQMTNDGNLLDGGENTSVGIVGKGCRAAHTPQGRVLKTLPCRQPPIRGPYSYYLYLQALLLQR